MTTDIDTAIKRIEYGISYGVVYLANGIVINAAKAIAEQWSKDAAKTMINYTQSYEKKKYNIDNPLFHNTYSLLRALTFQITMVSANKVIIHLFIDDDIEPSNGAKVRDIFGYLTYGVDNKKINIPARPLFYDVLGALNTTATITKSFNRRAGLQNAFDAGFNAGRQHASIKDSPEQLVTAANRSIGKNKIYTGKISNYMTGELRWL